MEKTGLELESLADDIARLTINRPDPPFVGAATWAMKFQHLKQQTDLVMASKNTVLNLACLGSYRCDPQLEAAEGLLNRILTDTFNLQGILSTLSSSPTRTGAGV